MNLLRDIFNSQSIVDGIDSQSDKVDRDSPDTLIYENLFPYLRIPNTQNKADCYILLSTDIVNINRHNPMFHDLRLTLWVLSHQDRMRMKGRSATRIDYIAEELRKMLDGNKKYGCGNILELSSSREIILNENYQYRELIYTVSDLKMSAYNKVGSFK